MNIFTLISISLLFLTAPLFSSELQLTEQEKSYLQKKKVIKICIDPHWIPCEGFDKNKKHIGMTSDYFSLFQKQLNIPIQIVYTKSWPESLEAAKSRKCDILSLSVETPERNKYMKYTTPYLNLPLVLVTKMDIPFINDIGYIEKKKIGIVKGYAFNAIIRKSYPNVEVVDVQSIDDGLQKVVNGELFGYIGAITTVGYKIQNSFIGELKIAGKFLQKWELGIGVRNDEPQLFSIFEKLVKQLSYKTKQQILNKYISVRYERGTDYTLLVKVLVVVLIIALIGLYYYRKLAKINAELTTLKDILQEQVNHDPMTNLYNRRYFHSIADDILSLAHREKKPLSVIMIDIDFFKKINDTYGHAVGDTVIKNLASLMLQKTRNSDIVARFGGEEFVILLPNTDILGAEKTASNIMQTVHNEIVKVDESISLSYTISLGITTRTDEDISIDSILNRADEALYRAKENGRDRIEVY